MQLDYERATTHILTVSATDRSAHNPRTTHQVSVAKINFTDMLSTNRKQIFENVVIRYWNVRMNLHRISEWV